MGFARQEREFSCISHGVFLMASFLFQNRAKNCIFFFGEKKFSSEEDMGDESESFSSNRDDFCLSFKRCLKCQGVCGKPFALCLKCFKVSNLHCRFSFLQDRYYIHGTRTLATRQCISYRGLTQPDLTILLYLT